MSGESIEMDPREVLKYLNHLGYCNITKEQLKEFIYDLKKLVKYDIRKCDCNQTPEPTCREPSGFQREQENKAMAETKHRANSITHTRFTGTHDNLRHHGKVIHTLPVPCNTSISSCQDTSWLQDQSCKASSVGQDTSRSTVMNSSLSLTTSSNSISQCSSSQRFENEFVPISQAKVLGEVNGSKENRHSSAQTVRGSTKSTSFIRPWRLTSATPSNCLARRNDPVSLYHHYQSLWKKQKMPGEDSHAELRWSIREKMLGQDPHPRPVSQASSNANQQKLLRLHKK